MAHFEKTKKNSASDNGILSYQRGCGTFPQAQKLFDSAVKTISKGRRMQLSS